VVLAEGLGESREALAARISQACAEGGPITGVVSLLALDDAALPGTGAVTGRLASTLLLVQALGDAGVSVPLWCLTCGAVPAGGPVASPRQAQVWGLGRVAALEYPQRWGGLVDVPAVVDARAAGLLAGVLGGASGEDQAAVRGAGVLGRRMVRAPLGDARPARPWQPSGTVLITGGTGALGAHVARWLARCGAPHLILASRRGPDAPGAAALEAELRALGTQVTLTPCDITSPDDLARVLAASPAEYPLRAVFHAAAVLDDAMIDSLTPGRVADVLRPKADAALTLHQLTQDADLSAFVLFSSFAGILPDDGQGNYAAANSFLDALAEYRRARGLTATSVAWGPWDGDGLAAGAIGARLRRAGITPMAPEHAISALA